MTPAKQPETAAQCSEQKQTIFVGATLFYKHQKLNFFLCLTKLLQPVLKIPILTVTKKIVAYILDNLLVIDMVNLGS